MAQKVFVCRNLPQSVFDRLEEAGLEYEVYPEDQIIPKAVLLEKVKDADALLSILTDPIDKEVFDAAQKLKIVANYAVGYNNIDVEEATKRGIPVTNTPGVLTDASADLAWALLFSTARRVVESDNYLRDGKFDGWGPTHFLGQDITGATLGIIGAGRIGQAVAKRAEAFSMKVLYHSRQQKPDFESSINPKPEFVELDDLLKRSDFVSIHVALTPETKHMIGERELKMMQPHSVLINTSRGSVIDEAALVKALKEGWIWGAGLDVYEEEPKVHPELINLKNAVLCPHIASATVDTRTKMGLIAANNIIDFFNDKKPANLVNEDVWVG